MTTKMKETMEVFDAIDAITVALKSAKADGEVNIWDAPKFAPAIPAGLKAINGADQIKVELASMDAPQMQDLAYRAMNSLTALVAAVIAKPDKK